MPWMVVAEAGSVAEALERGIERLEVFVEEPAAGGPHEVLVSVDLKDARLEIVVRLILEHARVDFVAEEPRLLGTITARFELTR